MDDRHGMKPHESVSSSLVRGRYCRATSSPGAGGVDDAAATPSRITAGDDADFGYYGSDATASSSPPQHNGIDLIYGL
eukprot:5119002-Pyramimonas_sp.AAC.1